MFEKIYNKLEISRLANDLICKYSEETSDCYFEEYLEYMKLKKIEYVGNEENLNKILDYINNHYKMTNKICEKKLYVSDITDMTLSEFMEKIKVNDLNELLNMDKKEIEKRCTFKYKRTFFYCK